MLIASPLKFAIQGGLFKVPNLLFVLISPLLEARKVHGQDDVDVGDGTGHFSNFFEHYMVIVSSLDDAEEDQGNNNGAFSSFCLK
jgi:hypothetical protein